MATPIVMGLTVAAGALAARQAALGFEYMLSGRLMQSFGKGFYQGGFEANMTRREACKILAVRESTPPDKIKEAHRRIMTANHPDAGGSPYIATKVNEAKEMLVGKKRGDSAL
ncbi:hypothetical protein PPROV_000442700 [Pycnococcus provasolii]|uniref:J domain-containing protein n=1 Tax=Pycnococcus provasolii TaxID=41880 RepID=A0A830HKZ9_9CHLO|nr:hypothetical protein PPROV_000442700 [Pycnococcus provasolii]|mmetsp:Transcript_8350/g.19059  ORF Transcript_8350/g.19059 Transcript_8350/m.19059 type:complete len:113 (+) Transcript_8350:25-363(+)